MNIFLRMSLAVLAIGRVAAASPPSEHSLTRAPELIHFVNAQYPEAAARTGHTASVRLRLVLDAAGAVMQAEVIEPRGEGFDEAAVSAAKAFRFRPAEVDGQPAPVQIEYVYHFVLEQVPRPPPPPKRTAKLEGQLFALSSRSTVGGALVRCGDADDAPEAVSDDQGRFTLDAVPGLCVVRVTTAAFKLFSHPERLEDGHTTTVRYVLEPRPDGFETVVAGFRENKEVARRTISRAELMEVPGTFGDPIRSVENLPGVATAGLTLGTPIVRGANPEQTAVLVDGIKVPYLFHLGGPSVLNPDVIDRLDFYPGNFSSRYGRATGGALEILTRKGADDTFHGSVKADLADATVYASVPVGKELSLSAALRYSYVNFLLPLVLPNDPKNGRLTDIPFYREYQVRVDGGPRNPRPGVATHTYQVMAFGSDDSLTLIGPGAASRPDAQSTSHTQFHRLKGEWIYRQGNLVSTLVPYLGLDFARQLLGTVGVQTDTYIAGLREDLAVEFNRHVRLTAGVDLLYENTRGLTPPAGNPGGLDLPFPGSTPEVSGAQPWRTFASFNGGVFAELELRYGPFLIVPGVRGTFAQVHGKALQSADPRLWVRYGFGAGSAIKAAAGLYSQAPPAIALEPAPLGNPNLGMQRAFQSSVGWEQHVLDGLDFDLTAYFNRRYDNILVPDSALFALGIPNSPIPPYTLNNQGLGRSYGAEFLLRYHTRSLFSGWVSYTLARAEERGPGPANTPYYPTYYDQTHTLTVVGTFRLPWDIQVGGRFRFITGHPYTPPTHPFDQYAVDANTYSGDFGAIHSARLPPLTQLDIRVERPFRFRSWTITPYLDLVNALNLTNIEGYIVSYRQRSVLFTNGFPIAPLVGVRATF